MDACVSLAYNDLMQISNSCILASTSSHKLEVDRAYFNTEKSPYNVNTQICNYYEALIKEPGYVVAHGKVYKLGNHIICESDGDTFIYNLDGEFCMQLQDKKIRSISGIAYIISDYSVENSGNSKPDIHLKSVLLYDKDLNPISTEAYSYITYDPTARKVRGYKEDTDGNIDYVDIYKEKAGKLEFSGKGYVVSSLDA